MKIPIKKSKKQEALPWHQDFRNTELLPDIKVIRTQFFLNVVALVLPLIVAMFWIQKEMTLGALRDDIGRLEDQKASMDSANKDLVALSRDFMKESAKIESLEEYAYNLFPISDYLLVVTETVPEAMVISSLELKRGNKVTGNEVVDIWSSQIAGYVSHSTQAAINAVNVFVEDIGKKELLSPYVEEAFLDNLSRDQATDTLNFVVSITLSGADQNEEKLTQ